MDWLSNIIDELRAEIEELRAEIESVRDEQVHPFYVGEAGEVIANKEIGGVTLHSVDYTNPNSLNLSARSFAVRAFNNTGKVIQKDDSVQVARDAWGHWPVLKGEGGTADSELFCITMTQVGGQQGSELQPATWTYDCAPVLEGGAPAVARNPVADYYTRPSLGQRSKATFGIARRDTNNDLRVVWCNEADIVAICEEAP